MSRRPPRPRPGGGRLWWEVPAVAAWLVILAASCFAADAWRTLARSARKQGRALELWAATVAGVVLGSSVAQLRPAWVPWQSAMFLAVAVSALAMSVGALGGHLHGRWLARRSAQEEGDVR